MPWGTPGAPVVGGGGNVETATILKSDLKKLKRSRLKAWLYFFLLAGAVGYGGYLGFQDRKELVQKKNQSEEALQRLKSVHNETVAKVSGGAAAAEPSKGAAAAAPALTGTATAKLADDLKRVLAGSPMAVETRGDRVLVFVDSQVLFAGREVDVGLGGYRTLYKFGKSLKAVKDRKIAVSVPSFEARKIKSWNLAAGRAVSLGRFFTDDLGFEKARVSVTAPAPRPAGKLPPNSLTGRLDVVLDPTGA